MEGLFSRLKNWKSYPQEIITIEWVRQIFIISFLVVLMVATIVNAIIIFLTERSISYFSIGVLIFSFITFILLYKNYYNLASYILLFSMNITVIYRGLSIFSAFMFTFLSLILILSSIFVVKRIFTIFLFMMDISGIIFGLISERFTLGQPVDPDSGVYYANTILDLLPNIFVAFIMSLFLHYMINIIIKQQQQQFKIAKNQEKLRNQGTADLKKISDKLQKVFETANEGFWEVDNDNITIDVNLKICDLLGKTKEELIGKDMFEFLTPEGKEIISYQEKEYRDKGQSSSYELSFILSNSKIINCMINAAPIFDEFGKKRGTFGMISDITYLKDAEKKLKKQIEKLDCLYEISRLLAKPNISIKNLLHDSLPLILRVSHYPEMAFARIFYDEYEYKSEKFRETEMKFSIVDCINKKKLEIDVYYIEENNFSEEEINLVKEIEERIKNEILRKEIEQENSILADIVENSNDAILSINLDGIILSWNMGAEKIFGYTTKEILGKLASFLLPSNLPEELNLIIDRIQNGEHISHFETKRIRKDGKLLDISLNASPIKNLKGEIIGLSAIGRDFTEAFEQQKQYQEQILKSSQFKSDFMASMSHELRTPLNSIMGFSDVLIEKFYGGLNDQQEEYVNNVRSSAVHLLNLINDILDISIIEAGKIELNIEDIQLYEIINQIEITLRPEFEKKNLKFEVIGLNSRQVISADSVRFKEILFNLLSNAVKYTKEGMIKLEVFELEDLWKFNVIDTGIGIKEEHFDLIFKEFKRVQSEFVNSVEGTGLGLSLTKKLVELHGGNIGFTSNWGEGSIFTFIIPKKRRM